MCGKMGLNKGGELLWGASGIIEGILTSIRNLIETTGMSMEQAMNALKIPEEDKNMYMDILKKQQ